jgi:hypothetical protein
MGAAAAQEAPHGPIVGAGDDVDADAQERARGGLRTVRHRAGAGTHECGVREAAVGHEDGQPGAHPERHDAAELPQQGLHVCRGVPQPQQVAEQRHGRGTRRRWRFLAWRHSTRSESRRAPARRSQLISMAAAAAVGATAAPSALGSCSFWTPRERIPSPAGGVL